MEGKIRITKEFRFETAHALLHHDGLCKNIHGHSYTLSVTVIGEPIMDLSRPDVGMVMDFSELKSIVKENIVNEFDHSLVLNEEVSSTLLKELKSNFKKILVVDYQPTSEFLLFDFVQRIQDKFPEHVSLHHVKLRETGTSLAEWYAEDNF